MKAVLVSLTSILLLAYGCGGTQTTIIESTTDGTGDSGSGSGDVGTGSSGSGTGTGADVVCDSALEDPGYGGYPFTSLSYTVPKIEGCPGSSAVGKNFSFSCTLCPGGLQGIKGVYKFYEAENVDSPNPNEWKETIEFKGNSFTNTIEGVDTDGKKKKVTATGYFFCPNPDEFSGIKYKDFWNVIMVYLTVDSKSSDPFGINVGATDLAFLGSSTSATFNDILIGLNLCWDENGSWQSENQYCKVGSELFGRECKNPFE